MEHSISFSRPDIKPLDLYFFPELVTKDPKEIFRLDRSISLANVQLGGDTGLNLGQRLLMAQEERGRGLVNRTYFIDIQADFRPDAVITLMNPNRQNRQSFERSAAVYKLLSEELSNNSDGVCCTPRLLDADLVNRSLVTTPAEDNVSWKTPQPVVEGMLQSFVALSKIKPTEQNKKTFPFEPIENAETPTLFVKNVIESRFTTFFEWWKKLQEGELGDSESEIEEYEELRKFIEDNGIVAKIQEVLERVKTTSESLPDDAFEKMPDWGLNTGDGNGLNFLVHMDDEGKIVVNNIDFDDARFGSISELVASTIWHPQNRQLFSGETGQILQKKLISNYVASQNFDTDQLKTFNTLLDLYQLKWCATVAKNLSSGRSNWRQLYGGTYKTRAEFLLKRELPLLVEMLGIDPKVFHLDEIPIYDPISWKREDIKVLKYPLTGRSPFGEYQIFVAEKVSNAEDYMDKINSPIILNNLAYPFSPREVFYDENPLLLDETKVVRSLGDGNHLVVHKFWSSRYQSGKSGEYGYITRDVETENLKGGLLFTVGEKEITQSEVSKVGVPKSVLEKLIREIDPSLQNRFKNLINVFKRLDDASSEIQVEDFEIIHEMDRFMTVIVATLNNGSKLTIKLNRENRVPEDSAAVLYIPRTKNGDYLLVRQKRMIIPSEGLKGANSKETLEASRGWISPDEPPLAEFAQEFGLRGGYQLKEGAMIPQDFRTDATNLNVYFIEVDDSGPSRSLPIPNGTDEYHEELVTEKFSGKEIVEAIQKGVIRDNFSIYGFALYMLRTTNELIVDDGLIKGKNIYLKRQFILQEGGFKYSIPEGPKNIGQLLGETLPNSASARQVDQVNKVDLETLESFNIEGLESVPVDKVIENIMDGVYDAPTASALIIGLLEKGYLKYNG